jgi:hypothetical protein
MQGEGSMDIITGAKEIKSYQGIGGWLILIALGLIITPIRLCISLINNYLPIFTKGGWSKLTTPGSPAYHQLWAPVLTSEIIGNLFFAIFALALFAIMMKKMKVFPKLMIAFIALNLAFIIADGAFARLIPAVAAQASESPYIEILRTSLVAVIWIPYFCVSVRVKQTFIK